MFSVCQSTVCLYGCFLSSTVASWRQSLARKWKSLLRCLPRLRPPQSLQHLNLWDSRGEYWQPEAISANSEMGLFKTVQQPSALDQTPVLKMQRVNATNGSASDAGMYHTVVHLCIDKGNKNLIKKKSFIIFFFCPSLCHTFWWKKMYFELILM